MARSLRSGQYAKLLAARLKPSRSVLCTQLSQYLFSAPANCSGPGTKGQAKRPKVSTRATTKAGHELLAPSLAATPSQTAAIGTVREADSSEGIDACGAT